MVRDAEKRKRKYETNLQGDQVGRAFKAQKDIMVDQEKTYFPQIAQVERKVKKLCEAQGIATYLIAQYINYARECYSKAKRFTQDTLKNELQYLAQKWASRGLLSSKLVEIAKFFGVDITAPTLPPIRFTIEAPLTRIVAGGSTSFVSFKLPANKTLKVWIEGGYTEEDEGLIFANLRNWTDGVDIRMTDLYGPLGIFNEGNPLTTHGPFTADKRILLRIINLMPIGPWATCFYNLSVEG